MTFIDILLLAVALSIDASVVSFSQGLIFDQNKRKNSFSLAFFVGAFQAIMPIIGWFIAKGLYKLIEAFDHWIAFSIFVALGIKFIYDALKKDEEEKEKVSCISLNCLLLIALATSIDALAAGATIYLLNSPILLPALVIGSVTFVNSLIGFWSGYVFKVFPAKILEIFAGLILIGLGAKVLIEHLF